ncbi:MAG: response regulator [Gemmatimonadetes bacterium]|nr:response regulator [Gemmatimonadota bacterium]MYH51345.1 response regulator [Gemmatimonadota bacterium]MYK67343.1 response regulator [Gemmatimonadota bacterium]
MTDDSRALQQRFETLEERISGLSAAILRISASLDLDTVLQQIVDSARALTDAACGVLTTVDEQGRPQRFLSSGLTPEEHRRMEEWDDGPRLFSLLRDYPRPLRLSDAPGYLGSLGFSTEFLPPYSVMQAMPVHHRGVQVGSLFLGDKEGRREFTDEDEEVLRLFASQAATAIANARTYRDEQRARASLEALVDTSPVGVVVFDARTGGVVSLNREAKRIVEGLRLPDRSPEQLPEVITLARADGREVAMTEFPLVEQLSRAETVRNEEVVLSVPDGRSVKTLLNATPIHAPDGGIESVVVTIQHLAPFEELERLRTEFLAIVSHELRAPLTSIKGSTATVLAASPGFAPAEMLQFFRIIDTQADQMSGLIGDLLDAGRIATGTLSISPEPSELGPLLDRARNTFLSGGGGGHRILVDLPPDLPRVMADRQRIVQVMNNLFANAATHSEESSPIQVAARHDGAHVAISVSDRGKGIPPEQLPHLFTKHAGADEGVRGLRGGLGLAICKGLVEAHGGRIRATSGGEGQGARFTFTLPVAEELAGDPEAADSTPSRAVALRRGREAVRILVVDDDPQTLRYVRDVLTAGGYTTLSMGDHRELARVIRAEKPHLVLLDLMLPGTDGIQLMESVSELADLPVIFISAYGRDETIARALGAGAADYIIKPFSPTELTARVRAALRNRAEPTPFALERLSIDYERRRVTVAGRRVKLTATEYEVLRVLSINAGRVSTYRSLLRQAWSRHAGQVNPKLVHAVVKRLRHKLGEDGAEATYILNERGVGYRMPAPDEG